MATTVMQAGDIDRALTRIAFEILEGNKGAENLVLLGIPSRGVPLAARLAERIVHTESLPDAKAITGSIDITMYRDDLRARPLKHPHPTEIPLSGIDDKTVVLVDDVLYSGRSVRAALDALQELGRPRTVRLAVLVDRGHRELPIRADYVGKNLPTSRDEQVKVELTPLDAEDRVVIA